MTAYTKTMAQAIGEIYPITEAGMSSAQIDQLKKAYEPMRGKKISVSNANRLSGIMDKFAKNKDVLIQIVKADIPFVSSAAVTRLISKHGMKGAEINKFKKEEMEFWAELDEASKPCKLPPHLAKFFDKGGNLKKDAADRIAKGKAKLNWKDVTPKGYGPNEETELDEGYVNIGGAKVKDDEKSILKHIQKTFPNVKKVKKDSQYGWIPVFEEVELDEKTKWKMGDGRPRGGAYIENERFWDLDIDALKYIMKDADTAMKANPTGRKAGKYADEVNDAHTVIGWRKKNGIKEEVELDETFGKSKTLDKMSWPAKGVKDSSRVLGMDGVKVALRMQKSKTMKPFAAKVAKMKTVSRADLVKMLPDSISGDDITKLFEEFDKDLPDMRDALMQVRAEKPVQLDEDVKEEIELEEGRMKELHMYIQQGKSAKEIAKLMKLDVKTIKALMSEAYEFGTNEYREYLEKLTPGEIYYLPSENDPNNPKTFDPNQPSEVGEKTKMITVTNGKETKRIEDTPDMRETWIEKKGWEIVKEEAEIDEASARADAKRSMKSDPSMEQDPFSKDVKASDEDIKGASKNIIMQMRKSVSLRGTFPVEFGDKKKVKIPVKLAQAVQDKYNSISRPAEKEKFQARVSKSYKDMLTALKENVEVKSFRDTILGRVDEKIKEKVDPYGSDRTTGNPDDSVGRAAMAANTPGMSRKQAAVAYGGGPAIRLKPNKKIVQKDK
jgi:hypothetical protein